MINPVRELREFVRASLVTPVERDHTESDAAFHRRRIAAAVTLILGATALAISLRIPPGNSLFYGATLAVAGIWTLGAFASGRLHLGHGNTRSGTAYSRAIVQSLCLGLLVLAIFLAGALVIAQIPFLRGPVDGLLDHARFGSLPLVALITAINGVAEELYFRGALYAAIGRRRPVVLSTAIYGLATIPTGVPLLVFAAVCLGAVVGLQRRVTGGVLGPIITHLTWSLGMLFLLPPALALWS